MFITAEMREHLVTFPIFFNDIDLTQYFIPGVDEGRGLLNRNVEIMTVPGRRGGYVKRYDYPPILITQEILIVADDSEELRKVIETLNRVLSTEEEAQLIFGDELDRVYSAVYAGVASSYEEDGFYKATIQFLVPRGFKEDRIEKEQKLEAGRSLIRNAGTLKTPPKIKLKVIEPITYLDIFTDKAYKRLGFPVAEGETQFDEETQVLYDKLGSKIGWVDGDAPVDGGVKTGVITSNSYQFYASSFGEGEGWHGPADKISLSAPLTDFKVEVSIDFLNPSVDAQGRMEWYLLDDQGQTVGKIAMKRHGGGAYGNMVEIRLGDTSGHFIIKSAGATGVEWRDFRGLIRLIRTDNTWTAYVAMVDTKTGRHHSRMYRTFIDRERKFMRQLAQVQLHFGQNGTRPITNMYANYLRVMQLNQQPAAVPVIARADDILEMNFDTSEVFVNGEPVELPEDFGGEYFDIPVGETLLMIEPFDAFDYAESSVSIRERML